MTRSDVALAAQRRVGTRWRHQGRKDGVALDCIGLLLVVALEQGIPEARAAWNDPDLKGYGREPDPVILLAACDRYLDRVDGPMLLGDIPVMKFETEPQHFGIITRVDPYYITHTYSTVKKVAEHNLNAEWLSRIVRVYRFRGLTD